MMEDLLAISGFFLLLAFGGLWLDYAIRRVHRNLNKVKVPRD